LEYFAFGETFVEEHSNTNRTPYLYNGKELDQETGLYYYEARYYDARTSIFVAADPHSENYPGWTPYNYCANNPINITDPTGMDWYDIEGNIQWKDQTGDLEIGESTYKSLGSEFVGKHKETGQRMYYAANGTSSLLLNEAVVVGEKPQNSNSATPSGDGYDIDKAVNYLNSNAITTPGYYGGKCSPYVPKAINAGFGDNRIPTNLAGGSYGPSLVKVGFTSVPVVNLNGYTPVKGDIAVIDGYPGGTPCRNGPCGHIQMHNGTQWVSDFFQTRPFWPGSGYIKNTPGFSNLSLESF
jgi:RHS repeat-associated protein